MTCSNSDEVTVVGIMDRCRSITKYGLVVGILRATTG